MRQVRLTVLLVCSGQLRQYFLPWHQEARRISSRAHAVSKHVRRLLEQVLPSEDALPLNALLQGQDDHRSDADARANYFQHGGFPLKDDAGNAAGPHVIRQCCSWALRLTQDFVLRYAQGRDAPLAELSSVLWACRSALVFRATENRQGAFCKRPLHLPIFELRQEITQVGTLRRA